MFEELDNILYIHSAFNGFVSNAVSNRKQCWRRSGVLKLLSEAVFLLFLTRHGSAGMLAGCSFAPIALRPVQED
jgi:hypothetical protein